MASKNKSAPAQPKQPSRKGKRAWRKNVDIAEVQTGLETLREEIIQGGPFAEKPSDELFALDIKGSEEIKKKHNLSKALKVDEILSKRSAVPAIDSRKRGRLTDGVVEPSSKRLKQDWVSKKEVTRLRQVADRTSHLDTDLINGDGSMFDLWASGPTRADEGESLEYVPKPKTKVAPSTIKRAPLAMTANGKPVRAIRDPNESTSYNPSFEAWDAELNRAGAEELAAEKSRLEKAQAEAEKQARIEEAARDDMGNRTDNESEWEGFDTEAEEAEMLKTKRPRRKTPAERNKINRRRQAEQAAKHERRMGNRQERAQKAVESMLAVVGGDGEAQTVVQKTEEDDSGDDSKLRRRKMGNLPISEKNLELVLPDELQESLRQLKPEGNLLQDRYRNLLVNGKIESRRPVLNPRKKKTKVTEKWSYKDFSVTV